MTTAVVGHLIHSTFYAFLDLVHRRLIRLPYEKKSVMIKRVGVEGFWFDVNILLPHPGTFPTGRLGVCINGRSDSFLLPCGGFESVAWHLKIVGRRSFDPNKTGPH